MDLSVLPSKPGCYLFQNKGGKVIYVGKAKNLKKRVSSYFQKQHEDIKTTELVKHIAKYDIILTDTEVEALLLESRLIKQYKPKYNLDLKHNERYAYIKITTEEYPRLITARRKTDGEYFGPFTSGYNRVLTLKTLNSVFGLRTCKNCGTRLGLNYHIGICSCPQLTGMSKTEYGKRIQKARNVLKGNISSVLTELESQMKQFASSEQFEYAKQTRDQIYAIKSLVERQKIESNKEQDKDIIAFAQNEDKIVYFVFHIEQGILNKRDQFEVKNVANAHEQFIMQYYSDKPAPKQVFIPAKFLQNTHLVSEALSKTYKIEMKTPQKGDTAKLLELATKNAEFALAGEYPELLRLKEVLQLPTIPFNIECYDISNLKDSYIVGAKVHFTNGQPNKALYRKFRIKGQQTQNDFLAMNEVLKRRLRYVSEQLEAAPDLIIIDGGRIQLDFALKAMKEYGLSIPMIGLAKKEEEIHFPYSKKTLNTHSNAAKDKGIMLLIRMRDEVHRFVINYHRKLRDTLN